jgi:hypothetical protein
MSEIKAGVRNMVNYGIAPLPATMFTSNSEALLYIFGHRITISMGTTWLDSV